MHVNNNSLMNARLDANMPSDAEDFKCAIVRELRTQPFKAKWRRASMKVVGKSNNSNFVGPIECGIMISRALTQGTGIF